VSSIGDRIYFGMNRLGCIARRWAAKPQPLRPQLDFVIFIGGIRGQHHFHGLEFPRFQDPARII
jgi:hypothetical protein